MKFLKLILSEGRREDFVRQFRGKFSNDDLKKIVMFSQDIATNNKFLSFLGKALNPQDVEGQFNKAKELLNQFIRYQSVLDQKDINQYETFEDIEKAVSAHENKVRRDVVKLDGADQVYEDDRYTIVTPKTHKASCYYGAGTKWCTAAMNGDSHFDRYNEDAKLFYIIDKKLPSDNKFYKVALLQKYDGDQTFFDALDQSFKSGWIFGTPEWEKINSVIQKYMTDNYSREIAIFADAAEKRKEVERIRAQREQQRLQRKRDEQRERMANDEWNLEENLGDVEVEKVNAIYQMLQDDDTVVGDENIYYLVPADYSHHGLDTYEWTGENETSTTWAVGTWDEVYEAAKDQVQNLWDDMGMEAFNQSFIENHLDTDSLYEWAYEFFYSDITDSPESYFDEDDLGLSEAQKDRISNIEDEIAQYEHEQYMLDDDREDYDELFDDFQDKIDELNSEKDDIESSPEGEASEEMIENMATERAQEAKDDPSGFIRDWGLDISNFIDEDSLIEDVVDSDGIGPTLNTYDGTDYEERINNTYYHIVRVD